MAKTTSAQLNAAKNGGQQSTPPSASIPGTNNQAQSGSGSVQGGVVTQGPNGQVLVNGQPVQGAGAGATVTFGPSSSTPNFTYHSDTGDTNAADSVDQLHKMAPAQVIALQQKLLEGGFYGQGTYGSDIQWGVVDEATLQAYGTAIQRAGRFYDAGTNLTLNQVMQQSIDARNKSGANAGINGNGKKAPTIQVDNPQDIVDTLQSTAQSLVGQKVDADTLGKTFVHQYQAQQIAAQQAAANGGTSTQAPTEGAAAESFIKNQDPTGVAAHDVANSGAQFFKLLTGGIQ